VPQGKGSRRADFEEAWERYCPGQIASRAESDIFIRTSVQVPVESEQVSGFASVQQAPLYGSKNSNLVNNHAGLYACTDKKHQPGAQSDLATVETPSDHLGDPGSDPGPIPESLRRHRCDHCGGAVGITNHWDWPGRPDGIWLHNQCESPWFDQEGRP
jgi:hypothetical protein